MSAGRLQKPGVEVPFIGQEEQPFGIGIEAADGINAGGKAEFRQRPVGRAVAGEPGQDAKRFVEGDEHESGVYLTGNGPKECKLSDNFSQFDVQMSERRV